MADLSNGRNGSTRAEQIARSLEDEIVALGWPLGRVLGSEPELVRRFDTSRAILREAVRIVELHGAALMRRGPGGGLVVTAPSREAVANAVGVWLASEGVLIGEVLAARDPLLLASARDAAEQLRPDDEVRLRELLAELEAKRRLSPSDFVALDLAIAEVGRNPALELFLTALGDVLISRLNGTRAALDPPIDDGASAVHLRGYRRLVEAIVAGDAAQALERRARLQQAVAGRAVDRAVRPRRSGAVIPATGGKLGARVAAAMRDDIERSGWAVGTVLGAETELREHYGVSRAVLREAVRILEYHGAVTTKRGPGGGVVVTRPDGQSIVRAAELALGYESVGLEQLLEVRAALEVAAVRRVAESCTEAAAVQLRAAVDQEPDDVGDLAAFHDVHRHLAHLSGSRPLALFVDVLTELTNVHVPKTKWGPQDLPSVAAEVQRAHAAIIDAVVDGDGAAAERRMVRHLQATIATLR